MNIGGVNMTSGIYKITCVANGKVYIGQAIDLDRRRRNHLSKLRTKHHSNEHLQRAFDKYGENNFKFEIIELCAEEELTKREDFYISHFNSMDDHHGFNQREAGKGGRLSERVKKKMSESRRGANNPRYGIKHTEETRKRISESLKKVSYKLKISPENRKKMREGQRNKPWKMPEELRKYHSEIRKGKPSPNKGKKYSYEIRIKMSEARKGMLYGEDNGRCKITEETAKKIIDLLLQGVKRKEIADTLGINICTIKMIRAKRTWKHLTEHIEFPKHKN